MNPNFYEISDIMFNKLNYTFIGEVHFQYKCIKKHLIKGFLINNYSFYVIILPFIINIKR